MAHLVVFQPFGQIAGDVTGPIVTQQAWLVPNDGLIASRCRQSQFDCVSHVFGPYVCAELPGNDIAAVIVQDRAEIKPAPADDLEVSEVGLPHLVDGGGFIRELVGCFDHHIFRRGDQVSFLQETVS
ncbi:hypothetical protein RUE5091_04553 [Ruegeria denitrificans]|uniref:Uncharacterized protein n=1 Tax=Ruegeria denitrificans TaxID=1715692 RepID=A0A0P1IKY9_9RHOB|nr:hypothetical protein RUE5091_04553 [Ruegeria denitrificans]